MTNLNCSNTLNVFVSFYSKAWYIKTICTHEHKLFVLIEMSLFQAAVETLNNKLLSLRGWHEQSSRLKYEGKMDLIIPMVNKFIHRSGLTVS